MYHYRVVTGRVIVPTDLKSQTSVFNGLIALDGDEADETAFLAVQLAETELEVLNDEAFNEAAIRTPSVRKMRKRLHDAFSLDSIGLEDPSVLKRVMIPAFAAANDEIALKMGVRAAIRHEVGDVFDIVADISKRTALLERMVMLFAKKLCDGDAINGSDLGQYYKPFVDQYVTALSAGQISDRIDKEPEGREAVFNTLIPRFTKIADLMEEYYFGPKAEAGE